ncbi:NAD-dependent epimerase/dehydratase family protein [Merdibacter massiliensis]|uniref:NAD-dependent epimerase/dehydratase family protein n=1 Tax=Merdibacter massiliensis TaxID=1871030 RepID=UPI00096A6519|nr:NAD(P)-dependent oxidoreductase [Merdibacter massiliensis]
MNSRVLVLGATGNLGAYSAIALKEAGYDVIAAGKRESDNGFFAEKGIEYYSIDITNNQSFNILSNKNIVSVVDLAGELPSRCAFNPQKLIQTITEATMNVLEFMRKEGIKKIIFPTTPYDLSYLHETGKPIDPDSPRSFPPTGDHSIYTIAKNAAVDLIENYHNEYGISRFILRFFTIYQYHPNAYHYADGKMRMMPYRMLMDKASKGETISIYGNPNRVKEMVYIKDFTKVIVNAVKSDLAGGFYNIGSPTRVSLDEMIHGIVEVFSEGGNQSLIQYDKTKPDTLQSMLDYSKTTRDLHYYPEYTYIKMLKDFKHEMITEPFSKLWGTREEYEKKYLNYQ